MNGLGIPCTIDGKKRVLAVNCNGFIVLDTYAEHTTYCDWWNECVASRDSRFPDLQGYFMLGADRGFQVTSYFQHYDVSDSSGDLLFIVDKATGKIPIDDRCDERFEEFAIDWNYMLSASHERVDESPSIVCGSALDEDSLMADF